jgi:UDP-N-acetylglucosamine 2-epimerase (non-hydrolysing)/GDP/UDP-N,N'-diacetylbacillosamine 2-epimerase (hydrolysing)
MSKKRKILIVTGKRGGFGALIPTLQKLNEYSHVETCLVATDQHLYEEFGHTYKEVQNWFEIRHLVPMDQGGDQPIDRGKALSKCLDWMSSVFNHESPDLLLVLGDRGEILTTVISAIHFKIPVAHIQGGDISGNIDEFVRHAITKLSHLHFASTQESAQRIIQMGEEPWRVHIVGDPHLDMIHMGKFTQPQEIYQKFNLDRNRPVILFLYHPETSDQSDSYEKTKQICYTIIKLDAQKIMVYPCTDPGYEGIIRAVEEFRGLKDVQIFQNIDCLDFWGLENIADLFIGNSSAGLIETPAFNLPSITIGTRQNGRLRGINCLTILNDLENLDHMIKKCLYDNEFKNMIKETPSPYGKGQAGEKIAELLATVDLSNGLFNKRMTY